MTWEVSAGVFLTAVIAAVVIYLGKKWEFPPGRTIQGSYLGFRVTLIYNSSERLQYHPGVVANALALALWAADQTWSAFEIRAPRWMVVHAMEGEAYDQVYGLRSSLNLETASTSILGTVSRRWWPRETLILHNKDQDLSYNLNREPRLIADLSQHLYRQLRASGRDLLDKESPTKLATALYLEHCAEVGVKV